MPNGFDSILNGIATAPQATPPSAQSPMFQMAQNQNQPKTEAGPSNTQGGGFLDWLKSFAFGGGALKTAAGTGGEKAPETQAPQSTDYLKQAIEQHMKSQQPLTSQKPAPDATKQPQSKQANF